MINITLPDGAVRRFAAPVTVADVARLDRRRQAKATLAGKVDDRLVDASHLIDRDARAAIVTDKSPEALDILATRPRTCWRRPCSACSRARRSPSAR